MPFQTVNPVLVKYSARATVEQYTCGPAALAQGVAVYLDSDNLDDNDVGKALAADADGDVGTARAVGVTANAAQPGQPVTVVSFDPAFHPGWAAVPGQRYVLSGTPGKIEVIEDMAAGWFLTDIGFGNADGTLNLAVAPQSVARTTTSTTTTTTP